MVGNVVHVTYSRRRSARVAISHPNRSAHAYPNTLRLSGPPPPPLGTTTAAYRRRWGKPTWRRAPPSQTGPGAEGRCGAPQTRAPSASSSSCGHQPGQTERRGRFIGTGKCRATKNLETSGQREETRSTGNQARESKEYHTAGQGSPSRPTSRWQWSTTSATASPDASSTPTTVTSRWARCEYTVDACGRMTTRKRKLKMGKVVDPPPLIFVGKGHARMLGVPAGGRST